MARVIKLHVSVILVLLSATEIIAARDRPVVRKAFSVQEQEDVNKLRPLVRDTLNRDYMKEDMYLVAWLRVFDLDIKKTSQTIRKAHQWRKDSNIERVISDDWSKFEKDLPYSTDGHDLEGRPLMTMKFGLWDVRKVVLAGQTVQYNLYLNRMMEIMSKKALETFNKTLTTATGNRDIVDWIMIHDLQGYNLRQHGCLACIPTSLNYASDCEAHYGNYIETNYILNTPRIFETVLKAVLNLLSPRSRAAFKVFGMDKQEYSAGLLAAIAPDQLPVVYGGTRRDKM